MRVDSGKVKEKYFLCFLFAFYQQTHLFLLSFSAQYSIPTSIGRLN